MNFNGIIVGAATFLIIGLCHPLVIKMEYYWGKKSWWLFFFAGVCFSLLSLWVSENVLSTILGATAFSCFWGIVEIFQQEKRVLKGWFPMNPQRKTYYDSLRKENSQPQ